MSRSPGVRHDMPHPEALTAPIYPVREDTELLGRFANAGRGRWALEIGCGQGAVSVAAARGGSRVVATDLNPHALRSLRAVALSEGFDLSVVRTDLASGLGRFDRILANPPYLPTSPAARDPDPWVNLALDGGPDGLAVTRRILASLPEHLLPGGAGFVLCSSRQPDGGRQALRREWEGRGGTVKVVGTRSVGDERLEVWELRKSEPRADLSR
ncbi:MAG: methyltransferase [Thermoplasmata archaeon]|nr:methyltransferase [Thermoplasmata archaeon]